MDFRIDLAKQTKDLRQSVSDIYYRARGLFFPLAGTVGGLFCARGLVFPLAGTVAALSVPMGTVSAPSGPDCRCTAAKDVRFQLKNS